MSRHRHFCTYFDHRYLPRGLALLSSLEATCPRFTLWVLTLSDEASGFLAEANLPNVRVVPLQALEAGDPALAFSRANRSLVEYYFTCTPCLPRFLMATDNTIDEITYLDSDLYFFSSPEPLFDAMGDASVAIVPHRFSPRSASTHGKYGEFNVGWLTFRNDSAGLACLDWWRARCIEWCHDHVEADRYADQKYLDQFQARFGGVHIVRHPGANLAPWNVGTHRIEEDGNGALVDGLPLVFFHFQGLRQVSARVYDSNLTGYGARLSRVLRTRVFAPYLSTLGQKDALVAARLAPATSASIRRQSIGLGRIRARVSGWARLALAALSGNLVRT